MSARSRNVDRDRRAHEAYQAYQVTGRIDPDAATFLRLDAPAVTGPAHFIGKLANRFYVEVQPAVRCVTGHDTWLFAAGGGDLCRLGDVSEVVTSVGEWLRYRGVVAFEVARLDAIAWGHDGATARAAGAAAQQPWTALDGHAGYITRILAGHSQVSVSAEYRDGVDLSRGVEIKRVRAREYVILPERLNPRSRP